MCDDPTTLVWFRRDLRVDDLPSLAHAAARGRVAALFVVDPEILGRRHHDAPMRLRFLRAGLAALDEELRERGCALAIRFGDPAEIVPRAAHEIGAEVVVATRERSPLGVARDERVATRLTAVGVRLELYGGDLVAEPEALPGSSGAGYRVFTPFFRSWSTIPLPPHRPGPERIDAARLGSEGLDGLPQGEPRAPAGPGAARAQLVRVITSGIVDHYDTGRDALAADATTRLSPYLRLGMCTASQIGRALLVDERPTGGRQALWRQLAWREFFQHLMARRPDVLGRPMRPEFRHIVWSGDQAAFDAWRSGETGVPLVDAAMRQLAHEGWMHNRARLVAASYLTKNLLVDWRRGESHFMRHLIDGDPASNNGGWQWVAGTGADAAPYFRVFSPTRQGERFDPHGEYIRRWVPELRDVPRAFIHEPWRMGDSEQRAAQCRVGSDYPLPRIDQASARARALAAYRAAASSGGSGAAGPEC